MAFKDSPFEDLRVPLTWTAMAATVIAAVVALAILLTDRREAISPQGYGAARSEFDEIIEPVSGVVAAPIRWLDDGARYMSGYFFAVSENRRLQQRIKELERWRDAAIALKNANTRYEALLKLRTEPPIPMVTGRAVVDSRGPFSNARLIDVGAASGVKIGNPVLSDHGVVGRVVGVSHDAGRVLLLTDVESRTPVIVDRTNARAILTGDGGANPRLAYVRGHDPVKEGDMVLTSGDGGVYPRGLPVGVVAQDVRGGWRVRLYADQADIDFVRVLVFDDFSQMVDQAQLSSGNMPPLTAEEAAQAAAVAAARAGTPAPAQAPAAKAAAIAPAPAVVAHPPVVAAQRPAVPAPAKPPVSPTPTVARPAIAPSAARRPAAARPATARPATGAAPQPVIAAPVERPAPPPPAPERAAPPQGLF